MVEVVAEVVVVVTVDSAGVGAEEMVVDTDVGVDVAVVEVAVAVGVVAGEEVIIDIGAGTLGRGIISLKVFIAKLIVVGLLSFPASSRSIICKLCVPSSRGSEIW